MVTVADIIDAQLKYYREHPDLLTDDLPLPGRMIRVPLRYEIRKMPSQFAAEQREEDLGL